MNLGSIAVSSPENGPDSTGSIRPTMGLNRGVSITARSETSERHARSVVDPSGVEAAGGLSITADARLGGLKQPAASGTKSRSAAHRRQRNQTPPREVWGYPRLRFGLGSPSLALRVRECHPYPSSFILHPSPFILHPSSFRR